MELRITKNIKVVSEDYMDDMGIKQTFTKIGITIDPKHGQQKYHSGFRIDIPVAQPLQIKDYLLSSDIKDRTVKLEKEDLELLFESYILREVLK